MRVDVTERRVPSSAELRPAGDLAPSLSLPWIVKLRYGVLVGQSVLILLAHFVFDVDLPIQWLAIPLTLTLATNLFVYRFARMVGDRLALGCLLAADILSLTALLALTGGPANPLSVLYLVQITLSAVVLSKGWTWSLGLLSVVGFGVLFRVHVPVPVFHMSEGSCLHLAGMWIAFVAAALLVTVFIGKVSEALRRREHEVLLLQTQLAKRERVASIGTLAAGAAHELGTPLATIATAARDVELQATKVSRDLELAQDARLIRAEVERCRAILQQMSARGAEPPGERPTRVELATLLETVRGGFPSPDRERVRVVLTGDPGAAMLPASAVSQALRALVSNALDAGRDGQPVLLGVGRTAGSLEFVVSESGCGMSPETLNRIAEPFFSTKGGTGLGTYLVRVFAEQLGGRLAFESELGRGTRVLLELPLITNGE